MLEWLKYQFVDSCPSEYGGREGRTYKGNADPGGGRGGEDEMRVVGAAAWRLLQLAIGGLR